MAKTFIDFIDDVSKESDSTLFEEFVKTNDSAALETFFREKGYSVSSGECGKLKEIKDRYKLSSYPPPALASPEPEPKY